MTKRIRTRLKWDKKQPGYTICYTQKNRKKACQHIINARSPKEAKRVLRGIHPLIAQRKLSIKKGAPKNPKILDLYGQVMGL